MKPEIYDTSPKDLPEIKEFLTSETKTWFGDQLNLTELIEKSYICVTQKIAQVPVSILCLDDFPPLFTITKDSWLEWMPEIYECSDLNYK